MTSVEYPRSDGQFRPARCEPRWLATLRGGFCSCLAIPTLALAMDARLARLPRSTTQSEVPSTRPPISEVLASSTSRSAMRPSP